MAKNVTKQDGHKVEVHTTEHHGGTKRETYVDGAKVSASYQKGDKTHEYAKTENGKTTGSFKK